MSIDPILRGIITDFYNIMLKEDVIEFDKFIDVSYQKHILESDNPWAHREDYSSLMKTTIKKFILEKLDKFSFGDFTVVYNKDEDKFYKRQKL